MESKIILNSIGIYQALNEASQPYHAPRQADESDRRGIVQLHSGQQFEQALTDLDGFERIWIIYQFDRNQNWKPMVLPPRGSKTKKGVFATRSPYRPNPLGLSCVRLEKIEGLKLYVLGSDLLDQTPILDIKPYLSNADSFPNSKMGWLTNIEDSKYDVVISSDIQKKINWFKENNFTEILDFANRQLEYEPFDDRRKRVHQISEDVWQLSYRTWRIHFQLKSENTIQIFNFTSGYSPSELADLNDPYLDKSLHKAFRSQFYE